MRAWCSGTYSAGGQATTDYLTALFAGGPTGAPALLFNSTVGNAAAGLTGLELKLRGPNATLSHKEASGLAAIVTAVDLLRQRAARCGGRRRHRLDLRPVLPRSRSVRRDESPRVSRTRRWRRSMRARAASCSAKAGSGCGWNAPSVARARGATPLAEIAGVGGVERGGAAQCLARSIRSRWSARCGWRWTMPGMDAAGRGRGLRRRRTRPGAGRGRGAGVDRRSSADRARSSPRSRARSARAARRVPRRASRPWPAASAAASRRSPVCARLPRRRRLCVSRLRPASRRQGWRWSTASPAAARSSASCCG